MYFFLRCISASSPIVTGYPPSRFMFDWRSQFFERKFPVSSGGATSTWAAERSDDQSNAEAFSVAETIDLGNAEFGISWYHMISESEGGALFENIWDITHASLEVLLWYVCIHMYTNLMTFRCIVLMNNMFLSSLSYRLTPPRAAQGTFEHLKPWQLQLHPQHWYCHC